LKEANGAKVYAHPADVPYIRGEKPHEGPFTHSLLDKLIAPVWFRRSARYRRMLKAATVDYELSDGERLPIGEGLEIVHTPGHTPGHISVLMPSKKLLFVGDAAANVFGLRAPVGTMFGLATADIAVAKESMRKIAGLDFDIACFGHGRVLKGAANSAFRRYVEKVAR
jgi:glyoxylase-like metal-dependent hydrolase (beta-lactamase superfamily II)